MKTGAERGELVTLLDEPYLFLFLFLLIWFGKVGFVHKYPMMVWTHQLSCCECSIFISAYNSHLFPSSSNMPRPLVYRHSLPLSNRYCMVVLKTCNEVMFFISVIPSEIRRFKFKVSWLCDDHIAADNLRVETSHYDSPLRAVEGLQFSNIDVILIASR
jgi:hypothetical protein